MHGEYFFRRFAGSLIPADEEAEQLVNSLAKNDVYKVRVSKPRNPRHHRLMFALLTKDVLS